jgi:cell division septation protein DedD
MSTPIGRDFKRSAARGGYGSRITREHWQGFAAGAALGLVLAVAALAWAQSRLRSVTATLDGPAAAPEAGVARPGRGRTATETVADPGADPAADPAAEQYEFYDRLKNSEVVVSDQGKDAAPEPPTALIERPGTYVLELGNWREASDAERTRAKAARLGVIATVQRVTLESGEFHRVSIGPFSKLDELNRTRAALRAAEIEALAIRVGD